MNEEYRKLQAAVDELLKEHASLRVLEAGCGSLSYVRWQQPAYIVGLDISPEQLARNAVIAEKILGDVQSYPLPARAFDAVVCWDVLEHLPHPEQALHNLFQATHSHGIVVVAVPYLFSLRSLIARLTPHGFHVWVYRTIFGYKLAGQPGHEPFPTHLRRSIAPAAIAGQAAADGLAVVYESIYESQRQRNLRARYGLTGWKWRMVTGLTRALSLGRIDANLTDCIIVLKRQ